MSSLTKQRGGSLEIITGCMFSGKTEELIRQVRRAGYARRSFLVFDHSLDQERYAPGAVASHSGWEVMTVSLKDPQEIYKRATETATEVVAVERGPLF